MEFYTLNASRSFDLLLFFMQHILKISINKLMTKFNIKPFEGTFILFARFHQAMTPRFFILFSSKQSIKNAINPREIVKSVSWGPSLYDMHE